MDTADQITVRLTMPDRWLEQVVELSPNTTVAEAKALGIRELLQRASDDPDDFYVECGEKEISDESRSLADIGVRSRGMLSIRPYDIGHNRRFRG